MRITTGCLFVWSLFLFGFAFAVDDDEEAPVLKSILWDPESGTYSLQDGISNDLNAVAIANFTNAINSTGWSYLEIKTDPDYPDHVQAFAAGYLEGAITAKILYMHWLNTVKGYCEDKEALCKDVKEFLLENLNWISQMTEGEQQRRMKSPYWHHVGLYYDQLEGLETGFNATSHEAIPRGDIYWMNIFGDLEDLEQVFAEEDEEENLTGHVLGSGSCSALIKVLPGNKDLYAAQDTWNSYQSMLRILKKYNFGFHWVADSKERRTVPGQSMTMSGYPGVIYSGDDFNVISTSGLVTMETTIGNSNKDLWKFVQPVGQVLEGVRATVANRLATTGEHWVSIFKEYNSGTYNNQWMVIDYKVFKPGMKELKPGLLWVLEQLPGTTHTEDVTDVLIKQGYWPSYNSPYFKDIFNMSGNPDLVDKYGDWFSYENTPRALIFKRDHSKIRDIPSMIKLMRYNDFQNDPLSACNCTPPYSAENAISARCDLNPKNGTYPFGALGHRSHGGTDMKLTSVELVLRQEFVAFGGPTYDDLPPFQWSKTDFGSTTPHFGHPDLWVFKPMTHTWSKYFD